MISHHRMADLSALRLVWISDGLGDVGRLVSIVRALVAGGVRAIQLREPGMSARALAALCVRLRPLISGVDGLLLVNDRVDVCLAGYADGVHVGRRSLSVEEVRAILPRRRILGASTHDPVELERARDGGADYAFLSPILATKSKPNAVPIGVEQARSWTRSARLPVVWLGGFDERTIRQCEDSGAAGFACLGAFSSTEHPQQRALLVARSVMKVIGGSPQNRTPAPGTEHGWIR